MTIHEGETMGQGNTSSAKESGAERAASPPTPNTLPVSRLRPAYQQVADQLRELILNGSLASGDRLPPEGDLGSNFGVSRSTVREALRVLASQGLVKTVRGTTGGTFVSRIEPAQISDYLETSIGLMSGSAALRLADILEGRELLEVPATALAARRREQRHLDALRDAVEREKHSRGRSVKFREHRHFHGIIIEASGNGLLAMMTEPVFRVLQTRFLNTDAPPEFWARVDQEHEAIIDRIEAGDAEGASAAMQAHLSRIRDAYQEG
ncbi:FadR/GntR family transcriptional regulator [Nonomuraea cavernae]|nr:FadR/GntR family transcriptional regulator [Nonomuraea cavernae]MCA2185495.1 FadR family transcriptional regulator [Nonomuraea cavernae]